ncbi:MAG: hypothetical protein Kilf2KO_21540 [Rhodospirillales bacterium]
MSKHRSRSIWQLLAVLLFAVLAFGRPANAHPHVWVEASVELEMEAGKVTGLSIVWLFDDFYSELVRTDFDLDRNGSLSQQELDALVGVSAIGLSEWSFFTHLRVGGEVVPVRTVTDFFIEDDGVQMLYRFRVPLAEPLDPNVTEFSVGFFDAGYYVDIDLADKDISVQDSRCRLIPKEALDQPLYFGLVYPTYHHLVCVSA